MKKTRVQLEVWVDLDPVPGSFDTSRDAAKKIEEILQTSIPHYAPLVNATPISYTREVK